MWEEELAYGKMEAKILLSKFLSASPGKLLNEGYFKA
jgi:hypothetical protein